VIECLCDTVFRHQGTRGLLWGAAIASLPDIDALGGLISDSAELILHRSFTHSILFVAIAPFLLAPLLLRLNRKSEIPLAQWRKLIFWCIATSILVDCFTTYGTKCLLPFSSVPVSFRAISVIDPAFTLPLIAALLCALRWRKTAIRIGLVWCASYLLFALAIKIHVHRVAQAAVGNAQLQASRVMSKPTPLNLFLWRINVDTGDSFHVAYYSLFDKTLPDFAAFPKQHDKLAEFANGRAHRLLARIMDDWYVVRDGPVICDLRYGRILDFQPNLDSSWVFSYILRDSDHFERQARDMSAIRQHRSAYFKRLLSQAKRE
jgi:inner membrane protein